MDASLKNEIQAAYAQLEGRQVALVHALFHRAFALEVGWYNGHYHKDADGVWQREAYPIPVIEVKGVCDVEVQFDKTSISTKLKRAAALAYSFEPLAAYPFEAYGVEDYLADFYHPGQTVATLKENIRACQEDEIGFSFEFPCDVDAEQMYGFVKLLRKEGFYY